MGEILKILVIALIVIVVFYLLCRFVEFLFDWFEK